MASTDVNYLNPSSLKPEIGWQPKGAYAGYLYGQNVEDYRKLLDQQNRLQAMAEEERRMQLEENRANLPLKDLQRQLQMEAGQGTLPFARDVAGTGAQSQINQNQVNASPEAKKAGISKFVNQMSDDQFKMYKNQMEQISMITGPALRIQQEKGDIAATQFVDQHIEQAKAQGIQLPPQLRNPQSWGPLNQAAIETPQFRQKIAETQEQGKFQQNVAEITGGHALQRGREQNASQERIAGMNIEGRQTVAATRRSEKFPSTDPEVVRLVNIIADAPEGTNITPEIKKLELHLSTQYDKNNLQGAALRELSPEKQIQHRINRARDVESKIKKLRSDYIYEEPKGSPGSSSGKQKSLADIEKDSLK